VRKRASCLFVNSELRRRDRRRGMLIFQGWYAQQALETGGELRM
jgi:hypothetical protein